MNSLIRLFNILSGLADSLGRSTKELVDLANARVEQSLGLDQPILTISYEQPEAVLAMEKTSAFTARICPLITLGADTRHKRLEQQLISNVVNEMSLCVL